MKKILFLILFLILACPALVLAQNAGAGAAAVKTVTTGGGGSFPNPLGSVASDLGGIPNIIAHVIKYVLAIVGAIALLVVVYGGFTWMTSAGNDKNVAKGKSILTYAVIGLVVIFLSWLLVGVLFQALGV